MRGPATSRPADGAVAAASGDEEPGRGQPGAGTAAGVEVVVDALRCEAAMWDEQAQTLGGIARDASTLGMTGLQAGVFALVAGAVRGAADQVGARCSEGRDAMHAIADALRTSAGTYEARDAAVAGRVARAR